MVRAIKVLQFFLVLCACACFTFVTLAKDASVSLKPDSFKSPDRVFPGWKTNTTIRTIDLYELQSGGPGKDGIPSIDNPRFIKPDKAKKWLKPIEPVISLVINGKAKAYPLQILMWHEIINDKIDDVPVLVTFCPLCYSAIVYDRRIKGKEYSFGVSGMLRYSNMIMYDRQTESWWQQLTGQAIVGDMVDSHLLSIPAQIISFEQFRSAYKDGVILSRKTGYRRRYGKNPYTGYDDINKSPFLYHGKNDNRLRPMEKLIAVTINKKNKAYPYSKTVKEQVINDNIAGKTIVVLHTQGAVSALDQPEIHNSRQVGSTGVFSRQLNDKTLTFTAQDGLFLDDQTKTTWDITGQAIEGPLKGEKLTPIAHGDYFAFAWLAFKPETEIYR